MSPKRAPSAPPEITGFSYVQLLGSGGFADVFLYQQAMPRRKVAVKVLLPDQLAESSLAAFTAEADLMASLSTHPSIVTIYQADRSADGRPYLVMEYCSRPNLEARYKRERLGVAEVLRIAIQVSGAVETAHRSGILHRDIKPANILVTEYNRPALTDFGISATTDAGASKESVGMSIPWSPPESFEGVPWSDARSDVYALAATVYTLLAGRSPFSLPGASNSSIDVISRIQSSPVPSLGRADVPASLERVLVKAMSKRADSRYATAMEFARALQHVQMELSMSVTPIDVLDDSVAEESEVDEDDGRTRIRSIVSIEQPSQKPPASWTVPQSNSAQPARVPTAFESAPVEDATVRKPTAFALPVPGAEPVDTTLQRRSQVDETPDELAPRRQRRRAPIVIGAIVVVGVVIGAVVIANAGSNSTPSSRPTSSVAPVDAAGGSSVPAVTGLTGSVTSSGVVFTWKDPSPKAADSYTYQDVSDPTQSTQQQAVTDPTVTLPADASGRTCVKVWLVRADGSATSDDDAPTVCAP